MPGLIFALYSKTTDYGLPIRDFLNIPNIMSYWAENQDFQTFYRISVEIWVWFWAFLEKIITITQVSY